MPFIKKQDKPRIEEGICSVTGYQRQSLQCANCRYNRVEHDEIFLNAAHTENQTLGSYCVAPIKTNEQSIRET